MVSFSLAGEKHSIPLLIPSAPAGKPLLAFRSLELTPLSAKAAIEADRQEACGSRADTDWLTKAGYGLMFHWTSQSIGNDGAINPFAQAGTQFSLDRVVHNGPPTPAPYGLFSNCYC